MAAWSTPESLVSVPDTTSMILLGNIRGLIANNDNMYKFNLIKDIAYDKNCFLICITESHLNEYISLNETDIDGFEQIRCDRKREWVGELYVM